jgi:hypothetical protein
VTERNITFELDDAMQLADEKLILQTNFNPCMVHEFYTA